MQDINNGGIGEEEGKYEEEAYVSFLLIFCET